MLLCYTVLERDVMSWKRSRLWSWGQKSPALGQLLLGDAPGLMLSQAGMELDYALL